MDYVLFKGMKRIGSFYPNEDEARKAIDSSGIWNICMVTSVDGKLQIVNRISVNIK